MSAAALGALCALLRAGAAALLLPLPLAGRLALALAGGLLLGPALAGAPAVVALGAVAGDGGLPPVALGLLCLREVLCGAALGLCAALPIQAAAAAGDLLVLGGAARRLLLWLALAIFAGLGGFVTLSTALGLSYELVPVGAAGHAGLTGLAGLLVALPARLLLLGLLLGAHPAAALLLAQLVLALSLRPAALQGELGAALYPPLRALFAAAALLLGSSAISAALRGRLAALPAELLDALRALSGR